MERGYRKKPNFFNEEWYLEQKKLKKTDVKIADELNVDKRTICFWKQHLDLSGVKIQSRKIEMPEFFNEDWYFEKKTTGYSDVSIAEELNISPITFRKWKKELGLKAGKFPKKTLWEVYKKQAIEKDVSYPMFMRRIRNGKTPEQAIEEGRMQDGRYGKEEKDADMEYDLCNRIKYDPEFHENHKKPFEKDDLIYICSQYGASSCRDIAFAVGKTENAIYQIVSVLRKNGEFDYYRSLDY